MFVQQFDKRHTKVLKCLQLADISGGVLKLGKTGYMLSSPRGGVLL